MAQRWIQAPPASRWGEFGPDDQRGRMNLVTPAKVLQGIAEVREGRTFCLSLPLDVPGGQTMNPRRIAPQRYAVVRDGKSAGQQGFCWSYASEDPDLTDVVNDDVVLMSLQYSTQWDSLAHVGSRFDADGDGVAEAVFYNGFRAGEEIRPGVEDPLATEPHARFPGPVAGALGIERLAEHGVQGRGVMIDLEHHLGRKRQAVGYDTLMRILEADRVEIEPGDMVCVHTGFADTLLAMNRQPDLGRLHETGSGLDGWDAKLLDWIVDVGAGLPAGGQPRSRTGRAEARFPHAPAAAAAAAARALPVQERHPSRRALVPDRAGRLAARERPKPLPPDGAAAAAARRGGFAGDAHRDGVSDRTASPSTGDNP